MLLSFFLYNLADFHESHHNSRDRDTFQANRLFHFIHQLKDTESHQTSRDRDRFQANRLSHFIHQLKPKMRFSVEIVLPLVPFFSHLAHARPQGGVNTHPCFPMTDYDKSGETEVAGKPIQLPTSCTPTGGDGIVFSIKRVTFCGWTFFLGCTVGSEESYTVEITTTIGAELGLDIPEIGTLAISGSVSRTEGKGTTDTASGNCKGPWVCSAIITPTMVEVSGSKISYDSGDSCSRNEKREPYTVQFPKVGSSNNPVINLEVCACTNKEHWADEGAPKPCLENCWSGKLWKNISLGGYATDKRWRERDWVSWGFCVRVWFPVGEQGVGKCRVEEATTTYFQWQSGKGLFFLVLV